jgi:hypothetical protein
LLLVVEVRQSICDLLQLRSPQSAIAADLVEDIDSHCPEGSENGQGGDAERPADVPEKVGEEVKGAVALDGEGGLFVEELSVEGEILYEKLDER